ncbi:MAG: biotin/lipoyl-binding protein, partial [Cyanobacteria bacterium P01_A01_bin.70]
MQIPVFGKVRRPLPWILGVIALGAIGVGIIGIGVTRSRGPAYDVEALTVPVAETALTVRITASGTVEPVQTVNLSPKTSGILENLLVEQGDRVTAGQVIAQMENDDVAAQIRLREAAVAEAAAQLEDVRRGNNQEAIAQAAAAVDTAAAQVSDAAARLDLAQAQLERNRSLATQGAISQNELDTFVQGVRSAEAALDTAQSQRR